MKYFATALQVECPALSCGVTFLETGRGFVSWSRSAVRTARHRQCSAHRLPEFGDLRVAAATARSTNVRSGVRGLTNGWASVGKLRCDEKRVRLLLLEHDCGWRGAVIGERRLAAGFTAKYGGACPVSESFNQPSLVLCRSQTGAPPTFNHTQVRGCVRTGVLR